MVTKKRSIMFALLVGALVLAASSTPCSAGGLLGYLDPSSAIGARPIEPEEPQWEQFELFPLITPGGGPSMFGIPTLDDRRDVEKPENPPFEGIGVPSIDERFDFDS